MSSEMFDGVSIRAEKFSENGHVYEMFEDDDIMFVDDFHTWVTCAVCGESYCVHCHSDWKEKKCSAATPLPGFDIPVNGYSYD